ncbi:hypothetical protein [Nostoc sp.]|uniref:hypothetical protein n=1 Tax=Nostoc sp. TaxID=1180 RepID=UPI002FF8CCF5
MQNWYRAFFPVGDEVRKFNALAIAFSGVEIEDALQKLLIINANLSVPRNLVVIL